MLQARSALALCLASTVAFALTACDTTPPQEQQLPPQPTRPTPRDVPPPITPIRMEKPQLLGPVGPAIILLPEKMHEPMVRVKLGGERNTPLALGGRTYRGTVESIRLDNGKYIAINKLSMESYLTGVLSRELYGSWEPEAYQAQAIAARTYALYQIFSESSGKLWDVNSDESSQVYGGKLAETAKARAAVSATRGRVLVAALNGQTGIFCSFFSSCSGGASQDPFDAWGDRSVGPLEGHVLAPYELTAKCPKFYWGPMIISKAEVTEVIQAWGARNGIDYLANLGPIECVAIFHRSSITGRPTELLLTDSHQKSVPIRAEEFRQAFIHDPDHLSPPPPSSNCDIVDAGANIELVNGRGYGHGIGLSQWGAQGMALAGKSTSEILSYYYPGAGLRLAW